MDFDKIIHLSMSSLVSIEQVYYPRMPGASCTLDKTSSNYRGQLHLLDKKSGKGE